MRILLTVIFLFASTSTLAGPPEDYSNQGKLSNTLARNEQGLTAGGTGFCLSCQQQINDKTTAPIDVSEVKTGSTAPGTR